MAQYSDWLPGSRADQIEMAKNWIKILTASPEEWNFPPAELTRLTQLNLTHNSMTDYMFQEFLTAKSNRTANLRFDGSQSKKFLLEVQVLPCYILIIRRIWDENREYHSFFFPFSTFSTSRFIFFMLICGSRLGQSRGFTYFNYALHEGGCRHEKKMVKL
jgi:hypothetical protein